MKRKLGIPAMWPLLATVAIALAGLTGPLATPVKAQRKVTRPQIVRPEGPVWQIIRANCTACHGIDDYAFHALDRAGWQSLIEKSHKASPVVLSDDDRNILLDWLVSKFGPDTKPFPRTYIPPEITTFFSDPEARRLLNRACANCHELTRVETARYPEDQWRVVAVDMRERGAKLTDEELERLVEWLGRVWGTTGQMSELYKPGSKEISVRFSLTQAGRVAALMLAGGVLAAMLMSAQSSTSEPIPSLTATTDNVSGAHEKIRIDVLRWSTDDERDEFVAAWTLTTGGGRGRGGRGAGARGPTDPFGSFGTGAAPAVSAAAAAAAAPDPTVERVRPRGGDTPPARVTPESSLSTALGKGPVVGHLWSSEVAGYGIHYAVRIPESDGGERIVLITDRRLGVWSDLWKPVGSDAATNYPFSVIELRLNSKGEGEGKVSLTGKVTVDNAAKTIALENYSGLPVVFRNVKRQNPESVRSK